MGNTENCPRRCKKEDLYYNDSNILSQYNLNAADLYAHYPPKFQNRGKIICYEKMKHESMYNPKQDISLTRWKCMDLPKLHRIISKVRIITSDTVFLYIP